VNVMIPPQSWLKNPVIGGLGVSLALYVGLALWEIVNGHSDGISHYLIQGSQPATMSIVILLTGFIWGSSRHATVAFQRDLVPLIPQLQGTQDELDALFDRYAHLGKIEPRIAGALGSLLGVLVIAEPGGNTPWLFSDQAWTHGFAAGIVVNMLLFWMMGAGAYRSIRTGQFIAALGPSMPPVDLLDLSNYAPFAHHGLRTALVWLGGSSIASLIYVNQNQNLMTAIVIVATVALGFYSLLKPMRGAHDTIVRAKGLELEQVRAAIRSCRGELLDSQSDAASPAAGRIPGLLSYEARINAVREWPLDVPTFVRFALLLSVAIGSWLGGAVVEMMLGSVLGD
jgi:hypothetical protein